MSDIVVSDGQNDGSGKKSGRLGAVNIDGLATALRQGSLGSFEAKSPYAAALMPLLKGLGWRGTMRELSEALPHFADTLEITDLRNILATLGYSTVARPTETVAELDTRLFPNLLVTNDGRVLVLLGRDALEVDVFDCEAQREITVSVTELSGTAYLVKQTVVEQADRQADKENWVKALFQRFRASMWQLVGLTLVVNILALAVPIFIMMLYDQVIPSGSSRVLLPLASGLAIALCFEFFLRTFRAKLIAFIGARIEHSVAVSAFGQILNLPANLTEGASLGSQVARIRDFDSIRDIFTSVLATVILELPFILIFISVIAFLAGWLAVIPVIMGLLFLLTWLLIGPALKKAVKTASSLKAQRHSFMVETVSNIRALKELNAEEKWQERYRDLSAEVAVAHHKTAQISFAFQSIGQTFLMIAGLAAIVWGVNLVIAGTITLGALIAISALTWRVLSPVQNLFLTLARAAQIQVALSQINQLMRMKTEGQALSTSSPVERHWQGAIGFQRVSFRYHQLAEPALLGVSLQVKPGEFIAVSGPNGSGKSSLIRMLLGLYRPQAGQITLDGLDLRQIDSLQLRQAIAYVPQTAQFFHGTIAQNLRLANPVATDEDLENACRMAGVLEDVEALPKGFEERIGDQNISQLNAGFRQKLSIARAYVKNASIIVMDEPAMMLDDDGDAALMDALRVLRGKATVFMISHRPSHIRLADKLILMNQGTIAAMGPPDVVIDQVPGGLG